MKKYFPIFGSILLSLIILMLTTGLVRSQRGVPEPRQPDPKAVNARSSYVPIQGRLTDAAGNPLDGTFHMTYRLYDVYTNGTALCASTTPEQTVEDGLFLGFMDFSGCPAIDGRQLYLGIQVGSDPEMTPLTFIDNVVYAWTLRPGANISATIGGEAVLDIDNYSSTGRGLRVEAQAASGINYAVVGAARSAAGYGGYFYNNGGGTGLNAQSDTGAALSATGSGIIRSSANSYLWISGNGLRPFNPAENTVINMDTIGGAKISRGDPATARNVMLPVAITGPLYGQNVTVTGLDIYWVGDTSFDSISAVLMRRQTGVCAAASCYASLLNSHSVYTCEDGVYPTGCVMHFDLTTNNVLTAELRDYLCDTGAQFQQHQQLDRNRWGATDPAARLAGGETMQRKIFIYLVLGLTLLLLAQNVLAMSSPNYRLDWFTPSTIAGGGPSHSVNFFANVTTGQSTIGASSNSKYRSALGYWYGLQPTRMFLPLISKY